MPGLFGYFDGDGLSRDDRILKQMQNLLIYANTCESEPFFHGGGVHAGYCAPEFETVEQHTAEVGDVACWFDGEIYNTHELTAFASESTTAIATGQSAKEMIIGAYENGRLREFLRKIDGYFSAVIYDPKKRQIKLLIDRYGFRHIFYTCYNQIFSWASECKAFLALPNFKIDVNKQSIDDFMKNGFLCEDRTWLDGVFLLGPAMILTYDIQSESLQTERYWSPEEISPFVGKFDINEFSEEWGRLFKLAVAKRTVAGERAGITLSGGLDSRAILAAMPLDGDKINAVTLGEERCDEAKFAAMAAKLKGANHHVFPLESDGWIDRASLGVWATDGALDITIQAGIEHLKKISSLMEVCHNGIGGGWMQGGEGWSHASEYHEFDEMKNGLPGLQMLRRRKLCLGTKLDESLFKIRMPFFDNDLYDFVMAIPPEIKRKGIIYNSALLHNFPQYYKKIPWQQAGVPISLPQPLFKIGAFYKRAASRTRRELRRLGLPVYDSKLFHNVNELIRYQSNFSKMREILSNKNAIYPKYMPADYINSHIGKNINIACRVLTFEVWMRQITDPSFRPSQGQL
ncbi:MAG: hypothetical protein LBU70_06300 [Chitinispirillales bacterium]|jgi:asparagine synthase (glutamine-hydrolysing)|nr:hypothetical protein [Chitinispirillales bacterium]